MSDAVLLSCILTHGDQAVVQGVNLHEVRLQKVLDGLNALLRFLLIGHFLMRDRAPALLHNLKHAQSLAYAHARILLALVHAGCTPVYCPSDTKHGHGGRCRQNQYMHAAVLSQSNETSTCRACFHVQPGSFPVAQSSTHSVSAPACRSHHASSALCGPAHTQHDICAGSMPLSRDLLALSKRMLPDCLQHGQRHQAQGDCVGRKLTANHAWMVTDTCKLSKPF